jgi:hypothetical protein
MVRRRKLSTQQREVIGRVLSDHHDIWCAHCFGYVDSFELHHVWQLAGLEGFAGVSPLWESWQVPVHRGECHLALQDAANVATSRIAAAALQPQHSRIDGACHDAFRAGDLNRTLFLRELAWRDAPAGSAEAGGHLKFALNALAGSAYADTRPEFLQETGDVVIKLYQASVLANAGDYLTSRNAYNAIRDTMSRWRRRSNATNAILLRREALLDHEIDTAREAYRTTVESGDAYTIRTARLALGWTHVARGDPVSAIDEFQAMRLESTERVSWWHAMEQFFGLGCATYLAEQRKQPLKALSSLIPAQYIRAMLALRGGPAIDIRRATRDTTAVTPTTIIRWMTRKHRLKVDALFELRQSMLRVVRNEVVATIRDL